MKLAILGTAGSWHAEQLLHAGQNLGHEMVEVDFKRLTARLSMRESAVGCGEVDLMEFDGVLVRGVPAGTLEQVVFRMDALHRLETAGVRVINPPKAIETCVDKYLTTARLQSAGIPVPRTVVCEGLDEAMEAFERLGKNVVVKPIFGSEGRGILRAETEAMAYRVFWTLFKLQAVLYIQEFIPHPGHDVRVLTIGDRVFTAMRRVSRGDFRTNVAQGGSFEAFELPPVWEDLALRAAKAVAAPIAGVDLLPDGSGSPMVIEVNSTPGFKALSQTTAKNIPAAMIEYLAEDRITEATTVG
ncbi:MAG: RimK family alpha-L-glutamate ligase [Planctomycetota bacterium]